MEDKTFNDKYCDACGHGLIMTAVICPKCGSPTRAYEAKSVSPRSSVRKKEVAVILAVFFSAWSWLYTYRQNVTKFWVGLSFVMLNSFLLLSTFGQVMFGPGLFPIASPLVSLGFNLPYILWFHLLPNMAIWIFSIVDNVRKPVEFFSKYPNGA